MKEGQDTIYYLLAESFAVAAHSPLLEIFQKKGIEVLLLSDPVDFLMESELRTFKGFSLQSVSRGEIDLSKIGNEPQEQAQEERKEETEGVKELIERIKAVLQEQVKEVHRPHA